MNSYFWQTQGRCSTTICPVAADHLPYVCLALNAAFCQRTWARTFPFSATAGCRVVGGKPLLIGTCKTVMYRNPWLYGSVLDYPNTKAGKYCEVQTSAYTGVTAFMAEGPIVSGFSSTATRVTRAQNAPVSLHFCEYNKSAWN